MATYKTTNGDYTITLGTYTGNSWTGTMNVNGNLNVVGNITYVDDIKVNDAFIVVAANNTGTVQDMGLVAQKSSSAFAGLRFDTVANAWQISSSTTVNGAPIAPYSDLLSAASAGGPNTSIQFNNDNFFAGNAALTFDYVTSTLTLTGKQTLGNIVTTPTPVANTTTIYHKAPGSGDTGLYVVGDTVDDEVAAYKKALLLSIIF